MQLLVLDRHAERYRDLLSRVDADVSYCRSPSLVDRDFDVLLAEPDFAAAYLRTRRTCRWIQSTWAGVLPVIDALREVQSPPILTGLKGIFGPLIAEYVFAYLLREVRLSKLFEEQQTQGVWRPVWPETLQGRKLTIVGTGSIGAKVAEVARVFSMDVTGVSRSGDPKPAFHRVLEVSELKAAVSEAMAVVLVLPETEGTRNLLNRDMLGAMRDDSILINVGRGCTLDEGALVELLTERPSRRALLDVFTEEPLPPDSPLWRHPNVTITPHVAAVSYPRDVVSVFTDNLRRYVEGRALLHRIDIERGY